MDIFKADGTKLIENVPILEAAEHIQELSKSDYVKLSWSDVEHHVLPIGAYIVPFADGVKYTILQEYKPTMKDELEYAYAPEFQHPMMILGYTPCLFRTENASGDDVYETDWEYTGTLTTIATKLTEIINEQTEKTFTLTILADNDAPASATVSFAAVDILSALNNVASAFSTEFHIDWGGNKIYFGEISLGSAITLEEGVNVGVASKSSSKEVNANYYVVRGGTRNITTTTERGKAVETDTRLEIADIDKRTSQTEPAIKKILVFDDVYPKLDLYVYNVRVRTRRLKDDNGKYVVLEYNADGTPKTYQTYGIYYVRLAYYNGSTWVDYTSPTIVSGKKLMASFEPKGEGDSGTHYALSGREFAMTYHSKGSTISANTTIDDSGVTILAGDYEINFETEGDIRIPDVNTLQPWGGVTPSKACDKVTLFNIVMDNAYIDTAKARLLAEANKEIARLNSDLNNYTLKKYPNIAVEGLSVGRVVNYKAISGYTLQTRIIKLITKLDYSEVVEITIGNAEVKGNTQTLREEIKTANNNVTDIAAMNDAVANMTASLSNAHNSMLEALSKVSEMWQFDDDGNLYTKYNTYSQKGISAYGNGQDVITGVTWNQVVTEGTCIGQITIDGHTTNIYAPTSGGTGTVNNWTDITDRPKWLDAFLGNNKPKVSFFDNDGVYIKEGDSRLTDARTPKAHTHAKADILDFAHTHPFTEITGKATVSQLPDLYWANVKVAGESKTDAAPTFGSITIGTITLSVDSNGNLKIDNANHKANVYATGGVSAYGLGEDGSTAISLYRDGTWTNTPSADMAIQAVIVKQWHDALMSDLANGVYRGDVYTKSESDDKFVTALGTNGNNLTWTKNGNTTNITVPYATNADTLDGYHLADIYNEGRGGKWSHISLITSSTTPTTGYVLPGWYKIATVTILKANENKYQATKILGYYYNCQGGWGQEHTKRIAFQLVARQYDGRCELYIDADATATENTVRLVKTSETSESTIYELQCGCNIAWSQYDVYYRAEHTSGATIYTTAEAGTASSDVVAAKQITSFVALAETAKAFSSVRTIALTGNVTGSASSDGTNGWSIATTIGNGVVTNDMLANKSVKFWGQTANLGGEASGAMTGVTNINSAIYLNNGNVGINVSSPTQKLHVNGGVRIGDVVLVYDSTNNALKVCKVGADGAASNDTVNLYATGGITAYGYGEDEGTAINLYTNWSNTPSADMALGASLAKDWHDDYVSFVAEVNSDKNSWGKTYVAGDYIKTIGSDLKINVNKDTLLSGYATQSWVSSNFNKYVISKADVEGVLTGTVTSHNHNGTYLVSNDLTAYLKTDGSNGTDVGVSALINKLTTGDSTPADNDYFIAQYMGGGTTRTTYHRKPISLLWSYIKGKADPYYVTAIGTSGNDLTWTKNGTVTNITVPYATNADTLDSYHLADLYNEGLGGKWTHIAIETVSSNPSNGYYLPSWYKIATVEIPADKTGRTYASTKIVGYYYNHQGNWSQSETKKIAFQCIVEIYNNKGYLYIDGDTTATTNTIRLVRIGTNTYELQYGCNTAWVKCDIYYRVERSLCATLYNTVVEGTTTLTDDDAVIAAKNMSVYNATSERLASNDEQTAWGQKYWTGGKPQTISGDMSGVGNMSFNNNSVIQMGQSIASTSDGAIKIKLFERTAGETSSASKDYTLMTFADKNNVRMASIGFTQSKSGTNAINLVSLSPDLKGYGTARFYLAKKADGTYESTFSCTRLAGTADYALKFKSARSIWGQSFDGSADVNGTLTPSAANTYDVGSNSLSFRNHYGTWFGAPSGSDLDFGANNQSNHLHITAAGLVGVGTTVPTEKLTVAGNIATKTDNGAYVQIGGAKIIWDNDNSALKVIKVDGGIANLYATGGLSAYQYGEDTVTGFGWTPNTFSGDKVAIGTLTINNVDYTIEAPIGNSSSGESSVYWSLIEGKPNWLTDTKPNVSAFTNDANYVTGNVLSTWNGTSYISKVGTITTGVWQGTKITDAYISSAAVWNGKQDAISDIATIRSNASNGNTAYGWGNHNDAGYFLASNFTKANIKTTLGISDWALAANMPTTSQIAEGTNLYFTAARAQSALSGHTGNNGIHITDDEREAWNNKWDYDENTIEGVKVNSAYNADACIGNAATATKFSSARTVALTGNITGSASSDGLNGWSIATTIANGAITNSMIKDGTIANAKLANKSVTMWGLTAALGESKSGAMTGVTNINSAIYLNNDGYVGLGTNNPQYPLDVNGNARVSGDIFAVNNNTSIILRPDTDANYLMSLNGTNGRNMTLTGFANSAIPLLTLDATKTKVNGTLQIGNATLTYDADNHLLMLSDTSGTLNVAATGGISAYGFGIDNSIISKIEAEKAIAYQLYIGDRENDTGGVIGYYSGSIGDDIYFKNIYISNNQLYITINDTNYKITLTEA